MIGMHQMSYSPAAAAAAAAAQTASQPAGRKSSRAPVRAKQQEHRQFPELEQEARRLAQYHQFDSTLEYEQRAGPSASQPHIVRVTARTAHPIVVGSLPDCAGRKPRNASRKQDLLELQRQIHYSARERAAGPPSEARHFLLQQALEQSSRDEQQVLLIMSDHGSKAAGVPVIGRRLPSKSFGPPPPGVKQVLLDELPPDVTRAILRHQEQQSQAPVVGRRSHRILEQQLAGADFEQRQAAECQRLSAPNPLKSQIETPQQQLTRRHASGASNKRLVVSKRKSGARIERPASSSCTSLCSPVAPVCLESCCRPEPVELLRCHANYVEARPLALVTSSPPPVCLLPCCQAAPCERPTRRQVRSSSQSASRRSHRAELGAHDSCQANGRSSRRSSQPKAPRHRHGHQGPPVPSKPSLPLAGFHTAEPLDENEHVTQMYESLAAELKAKLGNPTRAPILLPPKDYDTLSRRQGKLTGIELRRSTNPQLVGPAGPALSTAPAAAAAPNHCERSSPSTTTGCSMSNDRSGPPSSLSPAQSRRCGSTPAEPSSSRSSGRGSETNGLSDSRVDSLHRSRSNSSSGLGSISLGARSPTSACSPESPASKASSSEDIGRPLYHNERPRQQSLTPLEQEHAPDGPRGKGIENHNPSKVSGGVLWNGRVEIPLKVNSERRDGNTYLATKQIIY